VKVALQVASLVPIVPPVKVKLVPSENVYVPSVALSSSPTQYSSPPVFRVFRVSKIAVVFGPANIPFVARPSQEAFAVA